MTINKYDAISQMTVLTVLVFGPESVSYERSRRETAAKFHHCLARAFFEIISKSQPSTIYDIFRFFRILFLKNVLAQICTGQAHIGPRPMLALAGPMYGPGPYKYDLKAVHFR